MTFPTIHRLVAVAAATSLCAAPLASQGQRTTFTRADTLRGSWTTPQRAWWDVVFYDLHVAISPADSTIAGWNGISYRVVSAPREMQIDLMAPLDVDSMVQDGRAVKFRREGAAFFVALTAAQPVGQVKTLVVYYHGRPLVAVRPPWQGGFTWGRDSVGNAWVVTTDQGMGASAWWPNKDTQADEPDSQRVAITVPDPMVNISNGRLRRVVHHDNRTTTFEWFVVNPINNYAIAIAAGTYAHWDEIYNGEKGPLTMDFWPLAYHVDAARHQFAQARTMLACFEHWFGPYPWYEDGYKLIEVSNNGMEHQSAVSYGNGFSNGYRGRDASGTGLGMRWDFIIVHESAHEWFGNHITPKDNADMWASESFANYAEGIYTECLFGKEAGADYIIGNRRGIRNDVPIVPPQYGVNAQGSGDMYPKGGELLHMIRQLVNDDDKWRRMLRGLGATFGRQTVMGSQVEQYLSRESGVDLTKVFDQYLRTTQVPVFEWRAQGGAIEYRWANVVPGFEMPVRVRVQGAAYQLVRPTTAWHATPPVAGLGDSVEVDRNFYVTSRRAAP